MSRRATLEIVEAHETPESPLQGWIAAEDERLDARDDERREATRLFEDVSASVEEADDFVVEGLLKPLAAFGKGLLKPRPKRDPDVRWRNEIDALRAWRNLADTARRSPTARLAVHCETGGSFQAAQRPAEPRIDDGLLHVGRAVATLEPQTLEWTISACIELRAPSTKSVNGVQLPGGVVFASGQAMAASMREAGDTGATWQRLVADTFGLDAADDEVIARVDAAVKGARRALRSALRLVELDTKPRWLIPPATRREIDLDAPPEVVVTCLGSPIVDGVRGACEVGEALAVDVAACPRCERCGRPWGLR